MSFISIILSLYEFYKYNFIIVATVVSFGCNNIRSASFVAVCLLRHCNGIVMVFGGVATRTITVRFFALVPSKKNLSFHNAPVNLRLAP